VKGTLCRILGVVFFSSLVLISGVAAATANPALAKARQEAEAKGYIFVSHHDEIVAMAKKEGRIRVLTGLESDNIKPMADAFKKKYPFLDFYIKEISGTESYQRFILELNAGRETGWDSTFIAIDFYNDYVPFIKKFDVLGMASQGILSINPKMIDPFNRSIMSPTSIVQSVAFNKKLLAPEKVPDKWTDFLKPEFKGKKISGRLSALCHCGFGASLGLGEDARLFSQAGGAAACLGTGSYKANDFDGRRGACAFLRAQLQQR
jgi:hypothetical protein